jgi:hypothetical protein
VRRGASLLLAGVFGLVLVAVAVLLLGGARQATGGRAPGISTASTQTPLDAWAVEHLAFAQANLICCTKAIQVVSDDPAIVTVEIAGELAGSTNAARETFATGMMNNAQITRGLCLQRVVFVVGGRPLRGNVYENPTCD